jgi:hypothetical protein
MHGLNCMTDDDAGGESVSRACSSFCILGGVDELWWPLFSSILE